MRDRSSIGFPACHQGFVIQTGACNRARGPRGAGPPLVRWRPMAREFLEQRWRFAEVGREYVQRITGDPCRGVDRLVMPRAETDQDAGAPVADILDGVAIALRDVPHVTLVQGLDPVTAVGTEKSVTLTCPSMTYCHSSDVGCQWSSRNPPGSSSRRPLRSPWRSATAQRSPPCRSCPDDFAFRLLQLVLEGRQFLPGQAPLGRGRCS